MRLVTALLLSLCLSVLSSARADEPPSQVAPPSSASATPAAVHATPAAAARSAPSQPGGTPSQSAGAHSDGPPDLTSGEKELLTQGYKLQVVNGQKQFCRKESVLGSNIQRKVCGTADQLASARAEGRDLTDRTQRIGTNPNEGINPKMQ